MSNALCVISVVPCLLLGTQGAPPLAGPQAVTRVLPSRIWGGAALDAAGGRLFLPGAHQVRVVDLEGQRLGVVTGLPGVRAVGLAPELGIGFACSSRAGLVAIFNLATLEVEKRLRTTGGEPGSVLYDPATRRLFAFNEGGRNATAFDAFGGGVAGSIALGGRPGPAAVDGHGRLFVSVGDPGEIAVLDARRLVVLQRWSVPGWASPVAMAVDPRRQRLYLAGGDGRLAILDTDHGAILSVLPPGDPVAGLTCDPDTGGVFVAGEDGALRVLDGPAGVGQALETLPGLRAMVLDPASHRLYLPFVSSGRLAINIKSQPQVVPIRIAGDDESADLGTKGTLLEK